jgi:hypothetical protein
MLAAGSPVHGSGTRPAEPTSFWLVTSGIRFLASYSGDAWSVDADDGHAAATCEIAGDQSPVALFVMGRISAGHPAITVSGPSAAQAFKRYFPGP